MKKILIIGAGRSATTLINYLLNESVVNDWLITIADYNLILAEKDANNHKNANPIQFDVTNNVEREKQISKSNIVVSMLPAAMHILVAKDCVKFKKNLVTASYVSKEIKALNNLAIDSGIILLNEIGLDPGIDHLSAMKVIDKIKDNGHTLTSFKSFCGGLIHADYDNNPWNYKFTWNPKNVILAGQGTAQYILDDNYKYISYSNLFKRTESMKILDAGEFEGYANRDSLGYRKDYGLENISSLFRGTLRRKGFSKSWDKFVQLGMTDDSYQINNSEDLSIKEFLNLFLPKNDRFSVEENFCNYFSISSDSNEFHKFNWLGIFSDYKPGLKLASPAKLLQHITERKWSLEKNDKDMVVMQHQFEYLDNNLIKKLKSSLVVYGDDAINTAMAKTVGLPVAIAVKLILSNIIKLKGVQIPTKKEIYNPVLEELAKNGVNFIEELV